MDRSVGRTAGRFGGHGRSGRRRVRLVAHSPTRRNVSVSADSFEKLSDKIEEAKRSIRAAASESEAELKAKVDEARKNADDRAAELSAKTQATADKSEAHWQQIQSDWAQRDTTIEHETTLKRIQKLGGGGSGGCLGKLGEGDGGDLDVEVDAVE